MSDEPLPPKNDGALPISELIPSTRGIISTRGLIERIMHQFNDEYDEAFLATVTEPVQRRTLVRDVAEYIFGVEGVRISAAEKAQMIRASYSELLGFGGLDVLFENPAITTIALEGFESVSLRYAPGTQMQSFPPVFEDRQHMRRIVERLLACANAHIDPENPMMECGLEIQQRRVCISLAVPPVVAELRADIRLHPQTRLTLDDLLEQGIFNATAAQLLQAIARSEHGFVIVGEPESGKTTLMNALLAYIPDAEGTISVERALELQPHQPIRQRGVIWATEGTPAQLLDDLIAQALGDQARCIVIDEVRADEPHAISQLLLSEKAPRLCWTFRGGSDPKRVRAALGMLARMGDSAESQVAVTHMYERLPFLIMLKRRKGYLQLSEIAEWQNITVDGFADYVPLLEQGWAGCQPTGKQPVHALAVPPAFWDVS